MKAVGNHFRTVLEAFQRAWSDFQDLQESAMFKTMAYRPFAWSDFQDLQESAMFKTMAYRPFAQNRPIFDPFEFILNRLKQSHKQSEIILERIWRDI